MSTKPSEVTDSYWVRATAPGASTKDYDPAACGKWLVFASAAHIDEVWELIKSETEAGRLGVEAKAATAKPNPNARPGGGKLICVYTPDYTDRADVGRVLARLRQIGFNGRLSYKTDEATLAGHYGPGYVIYVSQPGSVEFDDRR